MSTLDPTTRALLDATLVMARELDATTVLQRIVDAARRILDARYAALGVISDGGDSLSDFVHAGIDDATVAAIGDLPTGHGVLGVLVRDARPLRLRQLAMHPDATGFPEHHPPMTSFLGVPIRGPDGVLGNLYFTDKLGQEAFSGDDETLAEALAAQAAVAITNARLHASTRDRAAQAGRLVQAVGALVRERDPDAVLRVVVDSSRALVDAEYAAVALFDDDGATFDRFVHAGVDPATEEKIGHAPVGLGLLRVVTVEGRPLRIAGLSDHPAAVGFPDHHPVMTTLLAVPLTTGQGVLGNLYVANKRSGDGFTDQDEELVVALAGQATVALERARSQEREQTTVHQLRSLLDANLTLTRELDPDTVLQTVVDRARDLLGAQYAALGVLGDGTDDLVAFVHSGMDPAVVEAIGHLPEGRGMLRSVILGRRPIRLRRLGDHPASVGFPPAHPPMTTFLGVPVEHQGRILGNLYLANRLDGEEFTEDDEDLAVALASQAAVALTNARSYEAERELVDRLRALDGMKTEFVSLVSHELRTPLVSLLGGSELLRDAWRELEPDQVDELLGSVTRQAGRLHDLINNLLDLSRVEQGRLHLALDAVSPARAARDAIAADPRLEAAGVVVEIPDDLAVLADGVYLQQSIANLLLNAVSYGGPVIRVTAEMDDETVVVTVEDDGGPIPSKQVPDLFERFVRGGARSDDVPGSGLGLSLVQAFVEGFGGEVWYEPGDGGWTRFRVRLRPVKQAEEAVS